MGELLKIKPHRIGITILVTLETSYVGGDFWDNPIIHARPQHCTEQYSMATSILFLDRDKSLTLTSSDMISGTFGK